MRKTVFSALVILLLLSVGVNANGWTWWNNVSTTTTTTRTISNSWTSPSFTTPTTNSGWTWWNQTKTQPTQPAPQPSEPTQPSQPDQSNQPVRNISKPSRSLTPDERRIIDLANQERRAAGLHPLEVDMDLVQIAKDKSHDMASYAYFSHVSPNYGTVYSMLDQAGVSYRRAGENIARSNGVDRAHELFMNSRGHRVNIMSSGFTHIGVGIVKWGRSHYVTQVFIRK